MNTILRKILTSGLFVAAIFACTALPSLAQSMGKDMPKQTMQQPTLYKRLGGYDALAAVTDDFLGRLAADPKLGKFLAGHSTDSLQRIRQLIVDQLCAATGGPCFYIGRSMKASHQGLGITEADWDSAVVDLKATLAKFQVPEKEQKEVLTLVSSLKGDIVQSQAMMK